MKQLTKSILLQALKRMGDLAQQEGVTLEVCLYGGALMMLAYDSRIITKDVDAIVRPSRLGQSIARRVGQEFGLPDQWLNDDVKMFLAPREQLRALPWEAPGIQLTAPTAGYLLAMKALACRPSLPGYEGDLQDLRFLIGKMEIRFLEDIQHIIDQYYPDDVLRADHRGILQALLDEVWT